MKQIKNQLFELCRTYVEHKISTAKHAMKAAQQEANLETKSSAGDKYETGRSMMQLEKEKYAIHLQEALRLQAELQTIDSKRNCDVVERGAVVETSIGHFFISISAGVFRLQEEYRCISLSSPIGMALESAEVDDIVTFRDREIEVLDIF